MTINNFKTEMISKAKAKGGIWENFGQIELRKLKDKYQYNPYANKYNAKEYGVKLRIEALDSWAMNFDLSQL